MRPARKAEPITHNNDTSAMYDSNFMFPMSTSNLMYPMGTMFPGYVDSALIPLLVRQLKKKGLHVDVIIDHNNALMYLVVNNVLTCNLVAIFYDLLNTPPINHRGILNNWADRIFDQIRMEAAELSIPDVLRQRVRTELVPTYTVQHPDFSYARPFPGGLSMILSIVHAAGTTRCTTEGLRCRPLGVDELFHYGQLNTDAITITITQKSGPTTCLSGPSPFIAAKAANMPAVIKQHAIEAPHGLFAIIPQQHLLFVAPATPNDLYGQLQTLVDFARFAIIDAQQNNPRHAVSRDIFYFSPEGTCETVTCSNDPAVQELLSNPQISPANYHFSAQKYLSLPPAFEQRFSRAGHTSPVEQNAQ